MRSRYRKFALGSSALKAVPFFAELEVGEVDRLLKLCEAREYPHGAEVVRHKETSNEVFFVLDGRAQVTIFSREGRVITFDEVRIGDLFGEMSIIDGEPRMASVTAVGAVQTLRMPGRIFIELATRHPKLGHYALKRLSAVVRQLCDRVADFHALPVQIRVASEYLRLAEKETGADRGVTIRPRPTDQNIANRVGTNREQVNRARHVLLELGLLAETRDGLHVPDVGALRRYVRGDR